VHFAQGGLFTGRAFRRQSRWGSGLLRSLGLWDHGSYDLGLRSYRRLGLRLGLRLGFRFGLGLGDWFRLKLGKFRKFLSAGIGGQFWQGLELAWKFG